MSEKTKKQHYVPQCYLKSWGIDGKPKIHVYDKEKPESRINSIEDVASGRYFYDLSLRDIVPQQDLEMLTEKENGIDPDAKLQIVEQALSIGIEDPYATQLTRILENAKNASKWYLKNCYFLKPDLKEEFAGFLAVQYIRTAHVRNMLRDISDEINQFVEKMGAPQQTVNKYRTLTKEEAKKIHIGMLMEEDRLSEIAFHFSNLKWVLGINRTESTFLTSDNPISIVPHCKYGPIPLAGLSSKGVEVFIPLSPECILIMRDGDYHRAFADLDMHYIELKDKRFIDSYNAVVCMFAERCIYSTDGDFSLLEQLKGEDSRMLQAHQTTLDWGEETIKSRVR